MRQKYDPAFSMKDTNMNYLRSTTLALLALGAGFSSSIASAQVRYAESPNAYTGYAEPYGTGDRGAVPYDRMGHFSCSFNEIHTRLERKNCGGTHYAN